MADLSYDNQNPSARRSAFTLTELLVVIAIIGILIALLLPAVQQAREASRAMACSNNLKQLALAAQNYHDITGSFPPGWDTIGLGWQGPLLPYIEQGSLYDTLIFEESGPGNWSSGSANTEACETLIPVFRCPSMPCDEHVDNIGIAERVPASYRGNAGTLSSSDDQSYITIPGTASLEDLRQNGLFHACSGVKMAAIGDGLSNTVLFGETRTEPDLELDDNSLDVWYIGSPQIDPCRCDGGNGGTDFSEFVGSAIVGINVSKSPEDLPGRLVELSFGSWHPGRAAFAFCDGSVRFLADTTDMNAYQAAFTRNGRETPGL